MSETTITVTTTSRDYLVHVGEGLIDEVGGIVRDACPRATRAQVISDSNVAPLFADAVARSLVDADLAATLSVFEAGEASKTMGTLAILLEGLAAGGLSRDDVVVAVGGGVTGDMAGLAASLYLRGIDYVQVPTSLLAMVDSSVGGKCAVDLSAGKNLAGSFWQPAAVVADMDCLDTLTPELLRDSLGEVVKYGVLRDRELFERLETTPLDLDVPDHELLSWVVARNVRTKRDVIKGDEREHGARQTLNLGHTIGHAVEAASSFGLGHGSSVAVGLCAMARAAAARGWCDAEVPRRIEALVASLGLPTDTDADHRALVDFAARDKKRHGQTLNIVVPRKIGQVEVRTVRLDELAELIDLGCGV
ncbi:3-dehydroquinate synthase [Olsenella massiliensis]|uniref:3-dehydroquinate synthase n=1 Tax=Olsenella massiliensis TaxID=1622075 RepID=UPI00071D2428|nr:3-dehydroquinate synthase [Olsenella massiliensis]